MVKSVTTVCERCLNFYVWFLKIYTIVTDLTIQTIVTDLTIKTIVTYLTIITIVTDLTISVQVAKTVTLK